MLFEIIIHAYTHSLKVTEFRDTTGSLFDLTSVLLRNLSRALPALTSGMTIVRAQNGCGEPTQSATTICPIQKHQWFQSKRLSLVSRHLGQTGVMMLNPPPPSLLGQRQMVPLKQSRSGRMVTHIHLLIGIVHQSEAKCSELQVRRARSMQHADWLTMATNQEQVFVHSLMGKMHNAQDNIVFKTIKKIAKCAKLNQRSIRFFKFTFAMHVTMPQFFNYLLL